jgi:hypothetical protein
VRAIILLAVCAFACGGGNGTAPHDAEGDAAPVDGPIVDAAVDALPDAPPCGGGCATRQHCDLPTNTCVCDNACATAGSLCDPANSGQVATCLADTNGCLYVDSTLTSCLWGTQGCPAGATACTCLAGACTIGQERCGSSGIPQRCVDGGGGCGTWINKRSMCGARQTCVLGGTVADCVCAAAPAGCSAAADLGTTQCASATTTAVCSADADGCFFLAPALACPSVQQTCLDSGAGTAGTCTCPSAACTLGTAASCSAGMLSTCELDAPGGCAIAASTDCTAAPYSSSCVSGPTAHCGCPAATAGTIYVNGLVGDDTNGTGAAAARCSYRTLTHALAGAASGNQVIAAPAVYGTGETFPLVLPSGVSFVTSATPTRPDAYVIAGAGTATLPTVGSVTATIAYSGAGTATLGSFTLRPGASATGLACTSGTLTVTATRAEGSAGTGFGLYGGCKATLTGIATTGNAIGVRVAASQPTAVTSATSTRDAVGYSLSAGSVDVEMSEVAFPTGNGVESAPSTAFGVSTVPGLKFQHSSVHDGAASGIVVGVGDGRAYSFVQLSFAALARNAAYGLVANASTSAHNQFEGFLMEIDHNGLAGIRCDTHSTFEAAFGGHSSSNGTYGIDAISGTCWEAGQPGDYFDAQFNGSAGVHVDVGGTFSGIGYARLIDNHGPGAEVAGNFSCGACNIDRNEGPGIHVTSGTFYLGQGTCSSNAGDGLAFATAGMQILGQVAQQTFAGNTGVGIRVAPETSASTTGTMTFDRNDLWGNAQGGAVVPTNMRLVATGNLFHSNGGNGLVVTAAGTGAMTIDPGDCTAAKTNSFYCYGTGSVGVFASAGASVSVGNATWAHEPPTDGVDFSEIGSGLVAAPGPCTPAITTCP